MNALDSWFELPVLDWEHAAQEAAFDGRCFCMSVDRRFINRHAMPADIAHDTRINASHWGIATGMLG